MANPNPLYHGFIGSEAALFLGQSTTDIPFQDLAKPGVKIRQSICCDTGFNFVFIEQSDAPEGPWATPDIWLPALHVLNYGPNPLEPQVSAQLPILGQKNPG